MGRSGFFRSFLKSVDVHGDQMSGKMPTQQGNIGDAYLWKIFVATPVSTCFLGRKWQRRFLPCVCESRCERVMRNSLGLERRA